MNRPIFSRRALLAGGGSLAGLMLAPGLGGAEAEEACAMPEPPKRFALAALGWVGGAGSNDGPSVAGNRLRWRYPASILAGGLPERLILERADLPPERFRLFKPMPSVGSQPTAYMPAVAWRGLPPTAAERRPLTVNLPPCQAVHFSYDGPATLLSVEDGAGRVRGRFALTEGSIFYLEADEISRLRFGMDGEAAPPLHDLRTLDLYGYDDYPFRQIAEIGVRAPLLAGASLDEAVARLGAQPDAAVAKAWTQLSKGLSGLAALQPPERQAHLSDAEALIGLSWQLAVLAGSGFADGPMTGSLGLADRVLDVLQAPSEHSLAYRLTDPAGGRLRSNIAFVDGGLAADLQAPYDFTSGGFAVRPVSINSEDVDGLNPKPSPPMPSYLAEGRIAWTQPHRFDLGVELEQETGPSPFLGTGAVGVDEVTLAPSRFVNLEQVGDSPLMFEVLFPDVLVRMALRAFDGFDRTSPPTPDLRPELLLDHALSPPVLIGCEYTSSGDRSPGRVSLRRGDGNQWPQDEALGRYGDARLFVYRRAREPNEMTVQIASVARGAEEGTVLATLSETIDAARFTGGKLLTPTSAYVVSDVEDQRRLQLLASRGFDSNMNCAPPNLKPASRIGLPVTLPKPGPATLTEPADGPGMWTDRTIWAENEKPPSETSFDEALPLPAERADVLTYAARFEYRRKIPISRNAGVFSNLAFVQRQPRLPDKAPSFEAAVLGRDHYGRLVVEIRLTVHSDRMFEAALNVDPAQIGEGAPFSKAAIPGVLGRQRAFQGRTIYEIFSSPAADARDLLVLIGVKVVDEAGQESGFEVCELLIEAQ